MNHTHEKLLLQVNLFLKTQWKHLHTSDPVAFPANVVSKQSTNNNFLDAACQ